jgi:hypothetical protein
LKSQFNSGFVVPPSLVVRYHRLEVLCAIVLNVSHLQRIKRLAGLSNDSRQGWDHHLTGELPPLPEERTTANLRSNNNNNQKTNPLDWAKIHQVQMQNLQKMGRNRHNANDVDVAQTTTTKQSVKKRSPANNKKNKNSEEKKLATMTSTTPKATTTENTSKENLPHQVAGLDCTKYGGPSNDVVREMVYWRNIPNDAHYASPFAALNTPENPKYLTFEPDEGGWNNIRMAMETAVTLAHATGRILVMPPHQAIYLLDLEKKAADKNIFTFDDFFHFDSIEREHAAVEIISFDEFLKREGMTGHLYNKTSGLVSFPPSNRTNWDGPQRSRGHRLWPYMRTVATNPIWFFDDCVVGIPDTIGTEGALRMVQHFHQTKDKVPARDRIDSYRDNPTPVDAAPFKRLREMLAHRRNICVYGEEMQNTRVFHVMGDNDSGARLLVHFVSMLCSVSSRDVGLLHWDRPPLLLTLIFLVNFVSMLSCSLKIGVPTCGPNDSYEITYVIWTKYNARRHALSRPCGKRQGSTGMQKATSTPFTFAGMYARETESCMVRRFWFVEILTQSFFLSMTCLYADICRGDFQYKHTRVDAHVIYNNTKDILVPQSTIYIATDERDKPFFTPLREQYNIFFLDDFLHLVPDLNKNYYGMLDQLIASRGRTFVGTYYSTFTGYINRIRGYHSQKDTADEYLKGVINSYYYIPKENKQDLKHYISLLEPLWAREFPVAWRDIDHNVQTFQEDQR